MAVTSFLNLQNALLILSSVIGVFLFSSAILKGYDSAQGRSEYRFSQILLMIIIGIMMLQMANYMDMSSRTLFGSNSYTLSAGDPWIVSTNVQSVLQQIHLATEDAQQISKLVAFIIQAMKLIGLVFFMRSMVLWYALAGGKTKHTPSTIIIMTLAGIILWNIGWVIRMISGFFGQQIQI